MRVITVEKLESILSRIGDNPRVVASGNFATPKTLLRAVDSVFPTYRLNMLNAQPGIPNREGITYETAFVGPGMRHHERLVYIPARLSLVPELFRDHYKPDVVLLHTSSQRFDTVSLGTEVNILPAAIEAVRERGGLVIAQANTQMPYTYGDAQVYHDDIDFLVEVDEPLDVHEPIAPSPVSQAVGEGIAARVGDGSTMQMGIGEVPNAVVSRLVDRKGLRIWTEMFSDGVLDLHKNDALDQDRPLTASFLFGSRELYDWVHMNTRIRMMRTEFTNNPGRIEKQALMTSVNSALQVDLLDQANASRIKGRIYSGFGGQTDFIVGALHSRGGQSFIALPSWHAKADTSTIVPLLKEPVTSFQHSAVATENGIADIFGRSQAVQARNIIKYAAHENVRDDLTKAAVDMRLFEH
jgi:acyl-CoA hydrolase|tara:strand:- start:1075 stop:2307 length:1233 start_codon:yes stop_codon:yes gene_type:complete